MDIVRLGDQSLAKGYWGEKRTELLNRTKILLHIPRYEGHLSDRLLMGMATGALVVSEPLPLPDPFEPGVHYVECSVDDMASTIRRLLADDELRRRITDAAFRFISRELPMERTYARLMELAGETARRGSGAAPVCQPVRNVPSDYYARLHAIERSHWWQIGMRNVSAALLESRLEGRGASLLDAGCGSGGFIAWLSETWAFDRLCGVDLSPGAIELARLVCPTAELHVAPLHELPFEDAEFDLVIANDVLQHVDDELVAPSLQELHRVSRQMRRCWYGRMLLATPDAYVVIGASTTNSCCGEISRKPVFGSSG